MRSPCSLQAVLVLALLACLAGCKSSPFGKAKVGSADEVPEAIAEARAELDAGRPTQAIDLLYAAREVERLPTEDRIQIDTLLERVAQDRILELADDQGGIEELEGMVDLGLPSQIAVHAGVTAANLMHASGEFYDAYRLLFSLENKYPLHPQRREAGRITADCGLLMSDEPKRFLGLFTRRDEGIESLEWLVVTYPSESRCDEAYFKLGELYTEDRSYKLAAVRYEDLIAYHLRSPLSIEAQARVPRMRLAGLESPEYDRRELLRAREELEGWLQRHAGRPEEEAVRRDYGDCLSRLILSDQGIARFYLRIGQPFGALLHAQRALDTARLTGDSDLVASSDTLVATARELEQRVAREGGREGFLDRPDAEVKPGESIATPPVRESEGAQQ